MSSFEGAAPARVAPGVMDARFAKRLVIINGLVPLLLIAWDAGRGQLGVNEVNVAIRTTGMLGLIFLVLSLVVTPLRKLTGWNPLIAVRRNLGVLGFGYLALHVAIFFVFDREGSIASTVEEIVARVYLWFGAAALLLMLPLAVTSTDGMVTRLGARRWKRLHRLSYPIAVCGAVHYYLLVKSDTRQPLAFAAVIGALLGYRAVQYHLGLRTELRAARQKLARSPQLAARPRRRPWSGELRIARIFDETPDIKTFRLVEPGGGPLPFTHTAGQYLNLVLAIDGKRVNRSYTIASSPRTDYCEISVKRAADGHASRHLHDTWREGGVVQLAAPAGRFVFHPERTDRCVLIAGGVGITPMMAIIRNLTDRSWPGAIDLLYSVRTRRDIAFRDELAYLQTRCPGLHVHITLTGDPDAAWDGERGHISRAMIERCIPGLARGPVLVCGPAPMMLAVRRLLVDHVGISDDEVLEEAFVSPPVSPAPPPAVDAASAAPPASEEAPASGELACVRFARTGQLVELASDVTVLEAAEDAGVALPFECRSGICGQCKTRLISGVVTMAVEDALTPSDRSKRLILACQAHAVGAIVVDA